MQHSASPADIVVDALLKVADLQHVNFLVNFEAGEAPSVTLYDYDSVPKQCIGGRVASRKVKIQARVRAESYAVAYRLAEQAANAILAVRVPALTGARWLNGPLPLGEDHNQNQILTLNFEFTYRQQAQQETSL